MLNEQQKTTFESCFYQHLLVRWSLGWFGYWVVWTLYKNVALFRWSADWPYERTVDWSMVGRSVVWSPRWLPGCRSPKGLNGFKGEHKTKHISSKGTDFMGSWGINPKKTFAASNALHRALEKQLFAKRRICGDFKQNRYSERDGFTEERQKKNFHR